MTAEEFSNQLADVITTELNELAPSWYFTRLISKPIMKWLSKEAIKAKRECHRLEMIWMSSKSEPD